jgi:hypothetical protein
VRKDLGKGGYTRQFALLPVKRRLLQVVEAAMKRARDSPATPLLSVAMG